MSKVDGWAKHRNGYEWQKHTDGVRGEIFKVSGGMPGKPYEWAVRIFPRPSNAAKWLPVAQGAASALSEAKAEAERFLPTAQEASDR